MTEEEFSAAFEGLPHNQAAENNKKPIFEAWNRLGLSRHSVFEIGSGTGQQGIFLCSKLPELYWFPSEVTTNLPTLKLWYKAAIGVGVDNFSSPIDFDIEQGDFPSEKFSLVYTSNVLHIVSNQLAQCLIERVNERLENGQYFVCYGPFKVNNAFTTESNKEFDHWLKMQGYGGLLDISQIENWSRDQLKLKHKEPMPANNFLLLFEKTAE